MCAHCMIGGEPNTRVAVRVSMRRLVYLVETSSTIHHPQSTVHSPQSTVHSPQSTVHSPSTIHHPPPSTIIRLILHCKRTWSQPSPSSNPTVHSFNHCDASLIAASCQMLV
ncbi:hypothetical protein F4859DRAFT_460096 [Xylaria cf. heliscus]|nr:hypothetical protein F4859DRAFT_460096 [Xylaria cf. heliscus]